MQRCGAAEVALGPLWMPSCVLSGVFGVPVVCTPLLSQCLACARVWHEAASILRQGM